MARKFNRIDDNPYSKEFFFKGSNIGILLIHGFTGAPGSMKKIGEELFADGYTVYGIRLPGHGTHITDMEKTTWQDWLDAARKGVLELSQKCDKVFVCGLSMGGLLSLILASELPIDGVIPIAAAVYVSDKMALYASIIKFFVRYRGSGIQDENDNPYVVNYACVPVRKVPDLKKLQRIALSRLCEIRCPLLIVQGEMDTTVPKSAAEFIFKETTSTQDKEILYLPNSPHVCTVEPEFDILIKKIREFIKRL
jgi:carboxylesterase